MDQANNDQKDDKQKEKDEIKLEQEQQNALPYKWRQTLGDVDIQFALPKGTKGKQLKVVMQKTFISIHLNGNVLYEGDISLPIKVQESTWLLDNGDLHLHLEKVQKSEWWKHVWVRDPTVL